MTKIDRRKFLTYSGILPIGLALSDKIGYSMPPELLNNEDSDTNNNEYFDPWLEIDSEKVAWNVEQVKKRVENRPIMAVIKCNAYGHGLVGYAKLLEKCGITQFAVVKVQEALDLRKAGIKGTILNFGPFTKKEANLLVKHDISQSVFSDTVNLLDEAAKAIGNKAKVHIKVDTGLGRVGVQHNLALPFVEKVSKLENVHIEGIFTTLTEETEFDKIQVDRLLSLCKQANDKGIDVGVRHAASSLAVSKLPYAFLDMVRPGNCLYGLEPLENLNLKQVLSLKTKVIYIKKMKAGDTISYHRRYKVEKETTIVTIPLGYADGYPFNIVNNVDVLINGEKFPMMAYMSANHVTIDVTGAKKKIKIGDEVILIGSQNNNSITVEDLAKKAGSSIYKIAIHMNPYLPRVYK